MVGKKYNRCVPADSTVSKIYVTTTSTSTRPLFKAKDITVSRSKIASLKSSTLSGAGFTEVAEYQEAKGQYPVVVAGSVWAPVNCGYDTDHLCGKLYQWGRMDGCGYTLSPASGKFYTSKSKPFDWYTSTGTQLSKWPMAALEAPSGSSRIGNPCPSGWRVPTSDELGNLVYSDWDPSQQKGNTKRTYSFAGGYGTIFGLTLPAAGYRSYNSSGNAGGRGTHGYYWSSSANDDNRGRRLYFDNVSPSVGNGNRAYGYSVRCVQE